MNSINALESVAYVCFGIAIGVLLVVASNSFPVKTPEPSRVNIGYVDLAHTCECSYDSKGYHLERLQ